MEMITGTLRYVAFSLVHNLPYLLFGILIAGAMKVYVNPAAMRDWLLRRSNASVLGSVAFGAFTPLCACGTMAVILSMLATALPWGAVMAFLTSSPLMSPDTFVLLAGVVGSDFAVALTVASIILGLGSGAISNWLERNTGFFVGQVRMADSTAPNHAAAASEGMAKVVVGAPTVRLKRSARAVACCSSGTGAPVQGPCGCPSSTKRLSERLKIRELLRESADIGLKRVIPYFAAFAGIGYIINGIVPQETIAGLFNAGNPFAVPLAALVGLPLYVSGSASVPLIRVFADAGASGGALLAFMVTGPGTSAGVMAGLGTIMKGKAIALYVAFLLAGGILMGYAYDMFRTLV